MLHAALDQRDTSNGGKREHKITNEQMPGKPTHCGRKPETPTSTKVQHAPQSNTYHIVVLHIIFDKEPTQGLLAVRVHLGDAESRLRATGEHSEKTQAHNMLYCT